MYIKSFGGQKGGSSEPLKPPLPTGLTTHLHHIATSDIMVSMNVEPVLRCLSLFNLKRNLTVTQSPNHLTTSKFGRPCTQFLLMCIMQMSCMCHTTLRMHSTMYKYDIMQLLPSKIIGCFRATAFCILWMHTVVSSNHPQYYIRYCLNK